MLIDKENNVKTCLSFRLAEEVFAIDVLKVINILEMCHITSVPKAPDYMKGVINLRGTVLPVIDLRRKFGIPIKKETVDTSIIVLSIESYGKQVLTGCLVDSVKEVIEMETDMILPSPSIGVKYNNEIIEGMWCVAEKFTMILDIDKIFSTDDVIQIQQQIED